ncbi:PP2C family protein-serine/threonine phosphatase [Methanogenium organophilum]|uniref:Protein phosphatase 2C domain-containing protein n=1 Tax=Methanogenium organophilum TaxID=2199 RepID=A0A9X9S6T8_METOG|nr:protein phosphatase 2C domain-containing protein [Methanogenium organophilum]WAI02541.1 protein phosphatase 2C domain-containing protein [Methanogenium organophilum]
MHTRFAYHAISVAGRRPNNEDAWGARWYGETLFCGVADGIGGRPAGDVASSCAIRTAEDVVSRAFGAGAMPDSSALLRQAHISADAAVKQEATGPLRGMGTTLTTALFCDGNLTTCNTGDSRCSLVRDGRLIQVTRDHSLVQEQIDAGTIRPEEVFSHPQKHIITRSIGALFAADVTETQIIPGDTLILSTDGMHDYLTPDTIVQEVRGKSARIAAAALLSAAITVSEDNITVCVITVSQD